MGARRDNWGWTFYIKKDREKKNSYKERDWKKKKKKLYIKKEIKPKTLYQEREKEKKNFKERE